MIGLSRQIWIMFLILGCAWARAEVISIAPEQTGFFLSAEPINTLYWQGSNSKALLLFIPGGNGTLGLKPGTTDKPYSFYQTLKSLTNPQMSMGQFDVVLLDSPAFLLPLSLRASKDHMVRIETAIHFYRDKTHLPIWIMGHSNGGISISEFIKYLQAKDQMSLISGVIASGIRNESFFHPPLSTPLLFLHHQNDGCKNTQPFESFEKYKQVKTFASQAVEYVQITSGEAENRDPCSSGFHMYFNAGPEVSKAIDAFALKILQSP
jgi:hypothetical protein